VRRADNLTTFMCRLTRNLGASTSWNPKGLSRPVMGLLYLMQARDQPSCEMHPRAHCLTAPVITPSAWYDVVFRVPDIFCYVLIVLHVSC
jgi:hypothetical protein